MPYNKLLYGKNDLERVVGVEIKDDKAEVFIRQADQTLITKTLPHKYWILSPKQHPQFVQLKGDLYYKYGRQFKTAKEYYEIKKKIREKEHFLIYDFKESMMVKDGLTYYKGMTPKELSVLSFDLETTSIDLNDSAKVLAISATFRDGTGKISKDLFAYDDFNDQGEMISTFCKWVREVDPDILLGHNINTFDIPYLKYCAARDGVELMLGRNGAALYTNEYESKFRKDGSQFYHYKRHKIYGREIVDTMFLALKYDIGRKYVSYGLKQIIKQEGLEKEGRVFYDASKIRFNYSDPVEWAKIKEYCKDDSDDALALWDLMSPSLFYMTQHIPKSFQSMVESATGSQINALMLRSYLQDGHSVPKKSETVDFEGAISLGNPGIFHNCWKVDVASLYPSIMIQYGLYDAEKDPKGYFKEMVETFTKERLNNKKLAKTSKYHDDLQNAQKIVINSAYGFLGAPGLNFNYPKGAAFVTEKGREILNRALDWAKNKDFSIVNADTDSITICNKDMSEISEWDRESLLEDLNSLYPDKIRFEDDGYYLTIIVLAAKNYVLWDGKKLKMKGSSIKDPKKELALQEFLKEVIDSIINKKYNYLEIYNKYVKEITKISDIKRWVSKKTITDKVLSGERTNETKVRDAIAGTEYREGDKVYMYYDKDDNLKLVENFDGNYRADRLLKKLYNTAIIFENVVDKSLFLNYSLKRNRETLLTFLGGK